MSFECIDRTRAFVKSAPGQTLAGTCAEDRDGRVVATLSSESVVLAREGKRLVGGPTLLTRTKEPGTRRETRQSPAPRRVLMRQAGLPNRRARSMVPDRLREISA